MDIESHEKKHWYWAWSQLNKAYFKDFSLYFLSLIVLLERVSCVRWLCSQAFTYCTARDDVQWGRQSEGTTTTTLWESIQCFFTFIFYFTVTHSRNKVFLYIYEVVTRLHVHIVQHALNTNDWKNKNKNNNNKGIRDKSICYS